MRAASAMNRNHQCLLSWPSPPHRSSLPMTPSAYCVLPKFGVMKRFDAASYARTDQALPAASAGGLAPLLACTSHPSLLPVLCVHCGLLEVHFIAMPPALQQSEQPASAASSARKRALSSNVIDFLPGQLFMSPVTLEVTSTPSM